MKHNIIKTDNYLLVVDDSEIKKNDWVVSGTNTIIQCIYPNNIVDRDIKKITAHLPLNNAPILTGIDLLLPPQKNIY